VGSDLLGGAILPTPSGSNLTGGVCPARASGNPCPIAVRGAPGTGLSGLGTCPAHATGHACPFAGSSGRKFRAPRFGMGSLGQTTSYTDAATGWSVGAAGQINNNAGSNVYDQYMTPDPGTYGPFTVDASGNVSLTATGAAIWSAASGALVASNAIAPPTPAAAAPVTSAAPAAAAPGSGGTPIYGGVAASVPAIAAAGASFFAAPTGYAAAPAAAAAPVSWWNQTTTLFGTKIANSSLAVGGAVIAAVALTMGKKKGR